ncbi:probable amino acid permease 7 [Arachis hypogaea]|uniref:probable amino acid permease 7 n=1 Tax=Arachis hypogaea TaxID=3818 RepID=UPI0010FC5BA3|nr:probable amino acid permease 7 [Arachis hypogaea]QHO56506.1 putative amino acid permease [Arachis hypogaea]
MGLAAEPASSNDDKTPLLLSHPLKRTGLKNGQLCCLLVNISLYGFGIAYVITSAISIRTILVSICYHTNEEEVACEFVDAYYMLIFGAIQVVLSQIPNFHNIEWLSVVAAIMSFAYSFIGMALSILQIKEKGYVEGSIEGIRSRSRTEKLWVVAQALGDISYSYPFSTILLEIQDTLKSPPPENQTMKKASVISVAITTFFYLGCGGAGYAAFGNDTPGNLLTGFGSSKYYWLVNFANVCIVVHLVGAYQVYSQPLFAIVENWFGFQYSDSKFVNHSYFLKPSFLPNFELNFLSEPDINHGDCIDVPLLQPDFGSTRKLNLLAINYIFSSGMYLGLSNTEA